MTSASCGAVRYEGLLPAGMRATSAEANAAVVSNS